MTAVYSLCEDADTSYIRVDYCLDSIPRTAYRCCLMAHSTSMSSDMCLNPHCMGRCGQVVSENCFGYTCKSHLHVGGLRHRMASNAPCWGAAMDNCLKSLSHFCSPHKYSNVSVPGLKARYRFDANLSTLQQQIQVVTWLMVTISILKLFHLRHAPLHHVMNLLYSTYQKLTAALLMILDAINAPDNALFKDTLSRANTVVSRG